MNLIKRCTHDPSVVFTMDGVDYYGSDAHGVSKFKGDLVVNLTTNKNVHDNGKHPEIAKHIEPGFEEIFIPWPDFGIPKVKDTLWVALHEYVQSKGWKSVCFHCLGGHGRTGTALSSMIIANANYTATEAVDEVRGAYCHSAVESDEQCQYLELLDMDLNDRDFIHEVISAWRMVTTMTNEEENRSSDELGQFSEIESE